MAAPSTAARRLARGRVHVDVLVVVGVGAKVAYYDTRRASGLVVLGMIAVFRAG